MASGPSKLEVQALTKLVGSTTLLNRQLSAICSLNGLKTTGVKNELQRRIIAYINEVAASGRLDRFQELQQSITKATGMTFPGQPATPKHLASAGFSTASAQGAQSLHSMPNHVNGNGYSHAGVLGQKGQTSPTLYFTRSPFYSVRSQLGSVRTCEVMQQHRNSIHISIRVQDYPILQQCLTDPTMRVLLFCAAGNTGIQEIAFPHQSELKVNGGEIKANLRGLKNKPGSTRPVDITDELRLKIANYSNNIEFTYALTTKRFYLVLYLCQTTSVSALVRTIDQGKRISKSSVIQEITKKAQDPDIETTSQVLSLQCPITRMRLETPCRSLRCAHIQCFDATSYLQLQEQGPLWLCPICDKSAPFEWLAVDEYVKDILVNTSKSVEQVTIEPDGQWRQLEVSEEKPKTEASEASFNVDDDDLAEISIVGDRNTTTPNRAPPVIATPNNDASRESSSMPRVPTSNKRPVAQVIDLTLSDDDEPPQPPRKRQYLGPNGYGKSG